MDKLLKYLSIGFQLDKRRSSNKGYPVKLRITYHRQPRYFDTGVYLSESEFEKIQSLNPRGRLKEIKITLEAFERKAQKILEKIHHNFSFDDFKNQFFDKPKLTDLVSVFDELIRDLSTEGRAGTASSYQCAKRSFEKFIGKGRKVRFNQINREWLSKYQKYMVENGMSLTTVGIYVRALRTVYNRAIQQKIIGRDSYPFGTTGYKIPASRNVKKALSKSEIKLIFDYKPKAGTWEEKALDLWLLSYLCNGANVKDICRLKHKNLNQKSIQFIRAKTERTSIRNQRGIVAIRLPQIDSIISKHGTVSLNPDSYVFPFLKGNEKPERELAITRQVTKNINTRMAKIGATLGIDQKVTTYTARHSYATILKRGGAPVEFISESLGHSNIRTTENYLDSFEDETKEKYANLLVNFK